MSEVDATDDELQRTATTLSALLNGLGVIAAPRMHAAWKGVHPAEAFKIAVLTLFDSALRLRFDQVFDSDRISLRDLQLFERHVQVTREELGDWDGELPLPSTAVDESRLALVAFGIPAPEAGWDSAELAP